MVRSKFECGFNHVQCLIRASKIRIKEMVSEGFRKRNINKIAAWSVADGANYHIKYKKEGSS